MILRTSRLMWKEASEKGNQIVIRIGSFCFNYGHHGVVLLRQFSKNEYEEELYRVEKSFR